MSKHKLLSIESATHALILLFTLTSWANIKAFLVGAGHDVLAAALLSGALGAALAIVSLAISKLDMQAEKQTFYALTLVGGGLALLSGALQAAEYSRHLGPGWAIALGFGVPCLGEIGLSLASSLFSKSQRRAELRSVNGRIEAAIVSNLDSAISGFDPSTIQKRIDKTLNRVALAAVGGVETNLMAVYGGEEAAPDRGEVDASRNVMTPKDLNAIRTGHMQEKMGKTFALIQCGDRSQAAIAEEVGVSTKTISRYIDRFREQGHTITVNGVCKVGA
ncbi:MAG TPA: winged helix-turn-helix domain-containing protein [Anaerolineaceae bacterium]|nr:winged helix-turn-helix domain-containing protein [Anaerolineaceae bacterium]